MSFDWHRLRYKQFWKSLWYSQVDSRVRPRQKWLTKQIPRTWCDPDYLIETCVFASLIYFWEEDRGEDTLRYQWEYDYKDDYGPHDPPAAAEKRRAECKDTYDRLLAAYNWAKTGQAAAQKVYDDLLMKHYSRSNLSNLGSTSRQALDETCAAETFMIGQNTFFLKEIVDLRKYMWS